MEHRGQHKANDLAAELTCPTRKESAEYGWIRPLGVLTTEQRWVNDLSVLLIDSVRRQGTQRA
jgi:hypothetical protein